MTVTSQVTVTSGGTLRATRTFILRLLVDSAGPEALRGDLQIKEIFLCGALPPQIKNLFFYG